MPLSEVDTRAKLIDPVLHGRVWTEDLILREETAGADCLEDSLAWHNALDYQNSLSAELMPHLYWMWLRD